MGGVQGMMIAFVMAGVMNFVSYFYSDTLVLKHYRAVEVTQREARGLYGIVESAVLIEMPRFCSSESKSETVFLSSILPILEICPASKRNDSFSVVFPAPPCEMSAMLRMSSGLRVPITFTPFFLLKLHIMNHKILVHILIILVMPALVKKAVD